MRRPLAGSTSDLFTTDIHVQSSILSTFGHRQLKTVDPIRSRELKQLTAGVVLGRVTTWEFSVLNILVFLLFSSRYLVTSFLRSYRDDGEPRVLVSDIQLCVNWEILFAFCAHCAYTSIGHNTNSLLTKRQRSRVMLPPVVLVTGCSIGGIGFAL